MHDFSSKYSTDGVERHLLSDAPTVCVLVPEGTVSIAFIVTFATLSQSATVTVAQ